MLIMRCPSAFDRHKICQTDLPVAGHGQARENRPIPVTGRSIGASLIDMIKKVDIYCQALLYTADLL